MAKISITMIRTLHLWSFTVLLIRAHSRVLLLNIFWKCDTIFFAILEHLGKFKNFEPYFLFAYFQMYKSTFNNNTVEFHTQCLLLNLALLMNWTLSSAKVKSELSLPSNILVFINFMNDLGMVIWHSFPIFYEKPVYTTSHQVWLIV